MLQCRSLQGCGELQELSLLFGFASKDGVYYDLSGLPDSVHSVSIRAPSARVKVRQATTCTLRLILALPNISSKGPEKTLSVLRVIFHVYQHELPDHARLERRSARRRLMGALWLRRHFTCFSSV